MSGTLPKSWAEVQLGDVCLPASQRGPSGDRTVFQYIDLGALDNKSKRIADPSTVSVSEAPLRAKQLVRAGDVLFSTVRVYLENIAQVPERLDGEVASTAFCVLRPATGIESRYLYYFVTSRHFVLAVNQLQRGNSPPSVQDGDIRRQLFPVAPSKEQERIASRIEELFSRIEEGERAFERVQTLVERYRQSILNSSVNGALTREWRNKRKGEIESGEELLQCILKARREAWERSEFDKMKAKGIKPANDNWRQRYKEPLSPDISKLPVLHDGWTWSTIDQLCDMENGDRSQNYPSRAHYVESGVPFINAGHIQNGQIDLGALNFISEERYAMLRAGHVQPGDLLFCLRGSLGKIALNNLERGAIASSLVILRPVLSSVTQYLMLYFQGPTAAQQVRLYDNGTAQPNLAAADLARFVVPLPPILELGAVVELAKQYLASANRQLIDVLAAVNQSSSLRQAILRDAFCGRLVQQDPDSEATSILLERIAAQRGADYVAPKRGRKKKVAA